MKDEYYELEVEHCCHLVEDVTRDLIRQTRNPASHLQLKKWKETDTGIAKRKLDVCSKEFVKEINTNFLKNADTLVVLARQSAHWALCLT